MIKCVSNKKVYLNREVAEEALIESHSQFEHQGGGPIAVYQCEDCGYFHLTSKGPINPRLAALKKGGEIDRARQANQWLHKIKRK
jgi:hypothetical protein